VEIEMKQKLILVEFEYGDKDVYFSKNEYEITKYVSVFCPIPLSSLIFTLMFPGQQQKNKTNSDLSLPSPCFCTR